jgi:hypothetical protein
MTLDADQFIRRFLLHILPKGSETHEKSSFAIVSCHQVFWVEKYDRDRKKWINQDFKSQPGSNPANSSFVLRYGDIITF